MDDEISSGRVLTEEKPSTCGPIGEVRRRPAPWLIAVGGTMLSLPFVALFVIQRFGLLTAHVFFGPKAIEPTVEIGGLPVSLAGFGLMGSSVSGAVLLFVGLCLDLIQRRATKQDARGTTVPPE